MKRLFSVLMLAVLTSTLCLATSEVALIPLKATHQPVKHHHAHKAAKHHRPKHSHQGV